MKVAVLDENHMFKSIKEVGPDDHKTSKDTLTVALPPDSDVDKFADKYYYNFDVGSFLPVTHVERFATKMEDYSTDVVDALVIAVCDLIDGNKPDLPEVLLMTLRDRKVSLGKKK